MLASLALLAVMQVRDPVYKGPVHRAPRQIQRPEPNYLHPAVIHWVGNLPRYEIAPITVSPQSDRHIWPAAINDNGDVAGSLDQDGSTPVLRRNNKPAWALDFGPASVRRLNNDGKIAAILPDQYDPAQSKFVQWSPQRGSKIIPTPAATILTFIDADGDWLGFKTGTQQTAWASIRGRAHQLKPLKGFALAYADAMNEKGEIVGSSTMGDNIRQEVTLWQRADKPQKIPLPYGFHGFRGLLINDYGVIAGTCAVYQDQFHQPSQKGKFAFISENGKSFLIPFDRPVLSSTPICMNSRGEIVGLAVVDDGANSGKHLPWLYRGGRTTFLKDLLPPQSPWEPLVPVCMNNQGSIAGQGADGTLGYVGFIMTRAKSDSR